MHIAPTPVRVLSQQDVRRLLDVDQMLAALERAFVDLSAGRAVAPPRVVAFAPKGGLGAMPGYLPGVALEVKAVSIFPANHERGQPSHQGLIALFDEDHGSPIAIMDAIHITALRTGGGAAVSVRALARRDARALAILGAGAQGHAHLATVPRTREFAEIRIASRNPEHAAELVARDARAVVADSFEEAVRGADVVCCCTDAREPILRFGWLKPGAHVTSVGGTCWRGSARAANRMPTSRCTSRPGTRSRMPLLRAWSTIGRLRTASDRSSPSKRRLAATPGPKKGERPRRSRPLFSIERIDPQTRLVTSVTSLWFSGTPRAWWDLTTASTLGASVRQ